MGDTDHMLEWMRKIQHRGQFTWNDEMTACTFRPQGGFLPQTDYMVYLEGDIRSHGGKMIDMHQMKYDALMIHFQTGP